MLSIIIYRLRRRGKSLHVAKQERCINIDVEREWRGRDRLLLIFLVLSVWKFVLVGWLWRFGIRRGWWELRKWVV